MAGITVGKPQVNMDAATRKAVSKYLKNVNSGMHAAVKTVGASGDKNSLIGCVEKLNKGFRDSAEVDKLYNDFNVALKNFQNSLADVDDALQQVDKYV